MGEAAMTPPQIGEPAPEFELKNQHGELVSLSALRGKKAVIVFYPFAFSGVCTGELTAIQDRLGDFDSDHVTTVGISVDHMYSLRAYADRDRLTFDLLSDYWPHGAVARSYGVFNDQVGCADRGTFILDRAGILRWQVRHGIPDARDLAEYQSALAAID
jgi:mycoredoxin-dependent peroxiredoxin